MNHTITVQILADSYNDVTCNRLTTFKCVVPRIILPQLNKHRILSSNTESSRAIPGKSKIESVLQRPYYPFFWGENKKGMSSDKEIKNTSQAKEIWNDVVFNNTKAVEQLLDLNLHKEYANRLIEGFSYVSVILSGTQWSNFINLRIDSHAQKEIQVLAQKIKKALCEEQPKVLQPGDLHLPYVLSTEKKFFADDPITLLAISSSRVATVSYNRSILYDLPKDIQRYKLLRDSGHWSAFEHAAIAAKDKYMFGNLIGFIPHRKIFATETGDQTMDRVKILNHYEINEYISSNFNYLLD